MGSGRCSAGKYGVVGAHRWSPATQALLQEHVPGASAVEDGTGSSLERGDAGPAGSGHSIGVRIV